MPSPFPGMDPWLEDPNVFPDLHDSLIIYLRDAINAALPEPYVASAATRIWIDDEDQREPDVFLTGPDAPPPFVDPAQLYDGPGLMVIAPEALPVEEKFVEIRSTHGDRLVTSLEVLSPSNKAPGGKGREQYLDKQGRCRVAGVALVEIDLLREGRHTTAVDYDRLVRRAPNFCYHVCVSGRAVLDHYIVAAVGLADRLPRVPIPLDPGVPPIFVELQPLLDRAYDNSRYARKARYGEPPRLPLNQAETAWADDILSKRTPTRTES